MAESSNRRRVGPLPWQIKLRMARQERQWVALVGKPGVLEAKLAAQQATHDAAMARIAAIARAQP